jgi:alpha-beta hydrolase superfamily lysophospholipase
MNNVCRCDPSGHKVSFVTVEPGVQLEVLDWGGTGKTLVLLTGLGDNAHVFDQFACQFNDRFHVIGITRRGFGRSSQPAHGYDVDTRARDDIAVLDKLNIREAVSGVKNSRVIELHDTNHYVFIVDEALVVREMRKFLLEE